MSTKKQHIAQNTMSQAVDLAISRLYVPKGVTVSKVKAKAYKKTSTTNKVVQPAKRKAK